MLKLCATLVGCLVLAACSPSADTNAAEGAISAFHGDLNAGKFDKIYNASSPDFKAAATKDSFDKFLGAVHSKLGNFEDGKSDGWNDKVTPSGHFVTMNYKATFNNGEATETFVYRVEGNRPSLVGYNLSSDALFLN